MLMQITTGDCLTEMQKIAAASVDMVLCDLPHGQTQNAWDRVINMPAMWEQVRRVTKLTAAVVLMAAQPFASKLVLSNEGEFRYDLIWAKNKPVGFLNAKKQPLRSHEHILVFYRRPPVYFPQMTQGHKPGNYARRTKHSTNYGAQTPTEYGGSTERYPKSVIDIPIINNDDPEKVHPTQKPVGLMEWLIRSYTQPGEVVLDFAAGSATTCVAAARLDRRFIGIELNADYARMGNNRIIMQ